MNCRGDLAGTNLKFFEDITPYTSELFNAAVKVVGPQNVSIYNTIVFAEYSGMRYSIKSTKDLKLLINKVKKNSLHVHSDLFNSVENFTITDKFQL